MGGWMEREWERVGPSFERLVGGGWGGGGRYAPQKPCLSRAV